MHGLDAKREPISEKPWCHRDPGHLFSSHGILPCMSRTQHGTTQHNTARHSQGGRGKRANIFARNMTSEGPQCSVPTRRVAHCSFTAAPQPPESSPITQSTPIPPAQVSTNSLSSRTRLRLRQAGTTCSLASVACWRQRAKTHACAASSQHRSCCHAL